MKSRLILFVLGLTVWILITFSLTWQYLLVGVFIAFLVSALAGDLFTSRPHLFRHFERYLWFFYYVVVFTWECLKANVDVALRVIHPACPIQPGIVKVKTRLTSDAALTFLANSITLTPGTLCVDLDKEKGFLYIHWISVRTQNVEEATKIIVNRFERILRKIFE